MKTSSGVLSWVLLALLALTSAILCIAAPPFGGWLAYLYFGTVYGLSLAVYFVTCRGIRSAARLIALVVVAAISWPVAYFGTFAAAGYIPGGTVHRGDAVDPAFPLIAFGGALGGFALLIPALLLLTSSVTRKTALVKALFGILLSAMVGGIAWELGPTLGALIWTLLPTAALPQPDSYSMGALFFVWQPVIALFIGWATSEERSSVSIQGGEAQSEVGAPAPQITKGLSDRAFALIVVSLVVLLLTRIIPVRLHQFHRELAAARKRDIKPSSVDTPVVQPMSDEAALILKEIGNYQPGHTLSHVVPVSHEKNFERPSNAYFSALYTRTGEFVPEAPLAPKNYVSVAVQQYPNSAWAQYFAEYPPNRYNSFDNPKQHAVVVQFNNRVRSSQLERSPGPTGYPLYYIWPSGSCVITIDYNTPDEDLAIVRAYLEKYPSSIP